MEVQQCLVSRSLRNRSIGRSCRRAGNQFGGGGAEDDYADADRADDANRSPTGDVRRGSPGGGGGGLHGQASLAAAAKALGMTTDELSAELWGGKTLADIA